jgi:hypothetical protein
MGSADETRRIKDIERLHRDLEAEEHLFWNRKNADVQRRSKIRALKRKIDALMRYNELLHAMRRGYPEFGDYRPPLPLAAQYVLIQVPDQQDPTTEVFYHVARADIEADWALLFRPHRDILQQEALLWWFQHEPCYEKGRRITRNDPVLMGERTFGPVRVVMPLPCDTGDDA